MPTAQMVPQIVMAGDKARTREDDLLTSHMAGDVSALKLAVSMQHILELVDTFGPLVGSELNRLYRELVDTDDLVAWDSPRKRAGELAERGLLAKRPPRIGDGVTPETEYELTLVGLEALEMSK